MPSKDEYWRNPDKHRAKTRAYHHEHKEWKRERNRAWWKSEAGRQYANARTKLRRAKDPVGYLLDRARQRAELAGVPFDLTRDDLAMPDVCPVFGVPFEWGVGRRGWQNMWAPSIDRIRPQLGYVRGNVRIICNRANHLKSNGTIGEIEAVLAYMKREGANLTLAEQVGPRAIVEADDGQYVLW